MKPRQQSQQAETSPPRWAERTLKLSLPEGIVRDSILGDLREEYGEFQEPNIL